MDCAHHHELRHAGTCWLQRDRAGYSIRILQLRNPWPGRGTDIGIDSVWSRHLSSDWLHMPAAAGAMPEDCVRPTSHSTDRSTCASLSVLMSLLAGECQPLRMFMARRAVLPDDCIGFSALMGLDLTSCTRLTALAYVSSSLNSLDVSCCPLLMTLDVSHSQHLTKRCASHCEYR